MYIRRSAVLTFAACFACSSNHSAGQGDAGGTGIAILLGDALCLGSSAAPPDVDAATVDPLCTTTMPTVSFAKDVAPILVGCTGEICHASWTYNTLVGRESTACCDHRWLILPGQASSSHVVQALNGIGCVPRMPLGGELPESSIATITAWVCQGALDN